MKFQYQQIEPVESRYNPGIYNFSQWRDDSEEDICTLSLMNDAFSQVNRENQYEDYYIDLNRLINKRKFYWNIMKAEEKAEWIYLFWSAFFFNEETEIPEEFRPLSIEEYKIYLSDNAKLYNQYNPINLEYKYLHYNDLLYSFVDFKINHIGYSFDENKETEETQQMIFKGFEKSKDINLKHYGFYNLKNLLAIRSYNWHIMSSDAKMYWSFLFWSNLPKEYHPEVIKPMSCFDYRELYYKFLNQNKIRHNNLLNNKLRNDIENCRLKYRNIKPVPVPEYETTVQFFSLEYIPQTNIIVPVINKFDDSLEDEETLMLMQKAFNQVKRENNFSDYYINLNRLLTYRKYYWHKITKEKKAEWVFLFWSSFYFSDKTNIPENFKILNQEDYKRYLKMNSELFESKRDYKLEYFDVSPSDLFESFIDLDDCHLCKKILDREIEEIAKEVFQKEDCFLETVSFNAITLINIRRLYWNIMSQRAKDLWSYLFRKGAGDLKSYNSLIFDEIKEESYEINPDLFEMHGLILDITPTSINEFGNSYISDY